MPAETHAPPRSDRGRLLLDLRTPLTVLLGRVQLLRRSHAAGRRLDEIESDLEAIEAAVLRLAAAVERADRAGAG